MFSNSEIKFVFKGLQWVNERRNVNQAYRKMQIFMANILKFLKYFLLIIYGVIYLTFVKTNEFQLLKINSYISECYNY